MIHSLPIYSNRKHKKKPNSTQSRPPPLVVIVKKFLSQCDNVNMKLNKAKESGPRFSGTESPLSRMLRGLPDLHQFVKDIREINPYRNTDKEKLNRQLDRTTRIELTAINLCDELREFETDRLSIGRLQKLLDLTDSVHVKLQELIFDSDIVSYRVPQKNGRLRRLLKHGGSKYELVGIPFGRMFKGAHGYHEGEIKYYIIEDDSYKIVYPDGDGEDLTIKELVTYCEHKDNQ